MEPAAAYVDSVYGRFKSSDALVAAEDPESLLERAWVDVLRAQRWFADPSKGSCPKVASARALCDGSTEVRSVGSILCALGAREALLRFDGDEFGEWLEVQRSLLDDGGSEPAQLWLLVNEAWAALSLDDVSRATDVVDELGARASAAQEAALVLEAGALKAMAACSAGAFEAALAAARRASRMARTEAMPQQEYLANLVLARTRRLSGKPYLATYILTALSRFASPQWRPWIGWELGLAPGLVHAGVPTAGAAPALLAFYSAAARGDREQLTAAISEATSSFAWLPDCERDTSALLAVTDPMHVLTPEESSSEVGAWVYGVRSETPRGLQGAISVDSPGTVALVVSDGQSARRFLASAVRLVAPGCTYLEPAPAHTRTDTAIATLLLAGHPGLLGGEFWQSIYGFPYSQEKHRTIRNLLHHRIRKRLDGFGDLTETDGRWSLALRSPIVLADPRCVLPREHMLLSVMARAGSLTPAAVAEKMGIPLRTAQQTLKELANDGACRAEPAGRGLEYRLEDTTFAEPTDC